MCPACAIPFYIELFACFAFLFFPLAHRAVAIFFREASVLRQGFASRGPLRLAVNCSAEYNSYIERLRGLFFAAALLFVISVHLVSVFGWSCERLLRSLTHP